MSSYRCVHALVVPKAKHHHRLCGQPARRDYPESITALSVRVSLSPRDLESQTREETMPSLDMPLGMERKECAGGATALNR
jgi:hypothetical protein